MRTPFSASAIASRWARVVTLRLTSACARSIAAAWLAWTTYTGESPSSTASLTLSATDVVRHWWYSGVGGALRPRLVGRGGRGVPGGHGRDGAAGALGEVGRDRGHVAERRRGQE